MYDITLNEWYRHLAVCGVLRRAERRARGIRIVPGPMLKRPLTPRTIDGKDSPVLVVQNGAERGRKTASRIAMELL